MRILVLTKRHHMGQDALAQLHGRTYAIPEAMAYGGHEVRGLVANYHPNSCMDLSNCNPIALWENINVRSGLLPRFDRYLISLYRTIREFRPDIIWTGSDALIVLAGTLAAKKANIPCILDLKDNYDAFGLSRLPFIKHQIHRAIKHATAVSCVSETLVDYAIGLGAEHVLHLPNAADGNIFNPQPKDIARKNLNLPQDLFLIGTAGALTKDRGIQVFSVALTQLAQQRTDFGILVAGPRDDTWKPPQSVPIFDLGKIPVKQVSWVFNALDVGIICNTDSMFGNHCYPQKFHEMQACNLPVIASRVGPFASSKPPEGLVGTFSTSHELYHLLMNVIRDPMILKIKNSTETWDQRAVALEKFMIDTLQRMRDGSQNSDSMLRGALGKLKNEGL